MPMKSLLCSLLMITALALSGCGDDGKEPAPGISAEQTMELGASSQEQPAPTGTHQSAASDHASRLLVHKSETCGCCALWVDHMTEQGFASEVRNEVDMDAVKTRLGVPDKFRSCHTAVDSEGYVFEGHVPAIAVRRFLENPPEGALGLAVPGMPVGSPGMEVDNQFQPYQILLLMKDGSAKPYGYVSNYESQFEGLEASDAQATAAPHSH